MVEIQGAAILLNSNDIFLPIPEFLTQDLVTMVRQEISNRGAGGQSYFQQSRT